MSDKKVDYLKEDPPIPGQDWIVISFIAPEDLVTKKNLYMVNQFMVNDINKTLSAQALHMAKYLNSKLRKNIEGTLDLLQSSIDDDDKRAYAILNKHFREMNIDEDEFVDECRRQYELDDEEINDRYEIYAVENRERLQRQFDEAHDHACSTRGLKCRGAYQRLEDANARAEQVRNEIEPNIHAFVAPMGKWLPLDVNADSVQDQKHMLNELNKLMGGYYENVAERNAHFQQMKLEKQLNGSMSTKERLQQKLIQKRAEKMKKEMDAIAAAADSGAEPLKSKKKRKHRSKKATNPSSE